MRNPLFAHKMSRHEHDLASQLLCHLQDDDELSLTLQRSILASGQASPF